MERRTRRGTFTRNAYSARKRLLAFLLAAAMILSNVGSNLNVVFAGTSEPVVFELAGSELVRAIEEAIAGGSEVTREDIDFTNGKVEQFEKLFFGEGKLYEAYPEIDGGGGIDSELRIFVRLPKDADDMYMVTGDEEILFLYINNGDETIRCSTNITRMVDGEEKVKKTKSVTIRSYESTFGDEEVNVIPDQPKQDVNEATSSTADKETTNSNESNQTENNTVPGENQETGSAGQNDPANDNSAGPDQNVSDGQDEVQAPQTGGEEKQETADVPVDDAQVPQEDSAGGPDNEAAASDSQDEASEPEEAAEAAEPEEAGEPVAAVTRHYVPIVAENEGGEAAPADDSQKEQAAEAPDNSGEAEAPAEEPAAQEENEKAAEPNGDAPATDAPVVDAPAADVPAMDAPAVDTPTADTPAVDTPAVDTPAGQGPAADSEATVPDGNPAPEENAPQEPADENPAPAPDAGANGEGQTAQPEEELPKESVVTIIPSATPSEGTQVKPEEQKPEDNVAAAGTSDLVGMGYCSTAKVYSATLNQLKALEDFEGYKVTYDIAPKASARIADGPRGVEEGGTLVFGVKNQIGYAIGAVTANGEALEAGSMTDNDDGTQTAWYTVAEVNEEQEVAVTMVETMPHPDFDKTVVIDGVSIHVTAPDGVLPEGTELEVQEVTEKVAEAVKEKVEAQSGETTTVNAVLAYDINLMFNGVKLDNSWANSENSLVSVTISGEKIRQNSAEADAVEILHMKTRKTETVEALSAEVVMEAEKAQNEGAEEIAENSEAKTVVEVPKLDAVTAQEVIVDSEGRAAIDVADQNGIRQVEFATDHFSIFTITFTQSSVSYTIKAELKDTKTADVVDLGSDAFLGKLGNRERVDVKTLLKGNVKDTNTDVNGNKYRFIKATATDNFESGDKIVSLFRDGSKLSYFDVSGEQHMLEVTGNREVKIYLWYERVTGERPEYLTVEFYQDDLGFSKYDHYPNYDCINNIVGSGSDQDQPRNMHYVIVKDMGNGKNYDLNALVYVRCDIFHELPEEPDDQKDTFLVTYEDENGDVLGYEVVEKNLTPKYVPSTTSNQHWTYKGSESPVIPGQERITTNVVFVRHTVEVTYKVTYHTDGASNSNKPVAPVDESSPYMAGSTVTVMDNTNLVGNNAHGGNYTTDFICWTTEKSNVNSGRNNLYYPGDTFDITQDMDFYPVFVGNRKDVRKIEFVADTNGMLSLSGDTAGTFAFPIISGSEFGKVIASTADIPVPVPNDTYRFTGWEIVVNGQTRKYSDAEAILSHYADLPVETDLTFIAKFVTVNDSTISVWFSGTNLRDGFDGKESIYPDNGISGDREWVGNINLSKALPGGSDLPYTFAQIGGYAQDILDIYRAEIPPERIIDGKLDLKYAGHIEIWEVESGNNAAPWVKLYDTSETEQNINFEDIKTKSGYELRYHVYFESPIVVGVNYYKLSADGTEPQYPASIQTVPGYHFTGDTIPVTDEMVNYILDKDTFKGYEFRYGYPVVGESLLVRENARTIRLFYGPQARTVTVTYHDDKGAELQKAYTEDSSYGSSYDVGDQIFDTLNIDDHHYVKESVTGEVSGTVTSNVTVDVVYALDDKGDNGPDGTADKYQVEVTYGAVNGTVSFKGPKYVTLYDESGNESESGTGHLRSEQIPTTQANEGYGSGSWSPAKPAVSYEIESATEFVVTYTPQERTVTVTYSDDNGKALQDAVTLNTSYNSSYDVSGQIYEFLDIDGHHYIKESVTGEVSGTVTSNVTVDVVYTLDDKGDHGPDGTADKYQAEVTYQAVNGTVSFNGPKYVTLYDERGKESESGTGYLKADQIPDTHAGEGYEGGSWSPEKPTVSYPIKAATEFVVTYTAQERTVTVTYHDDKGVELREAYTLNTTYGSSYNVGDQISDTLDVGGHHYIKESVTGEVSGTVTSNVTVDVVYTLDDEGNGGPDDIPDKYQVRFEYKSEDTAKLVLSGTLVEWQTFPKKGDEYDTTEKLYPSVDVTRKELGGYHFAGWTDEKGGAFESDAALQNTGYTTNMTFIAKAAENEGVAINYISEDPAKGTVTLDAESVAPVTGAPKGSEAKPADGYVFTHWTNDNGDTVASGEENRHYTPVKNAQSEVFEADTYTAHFAERGDLSYKVEYYFDGKLGETVSQNNVKLGTAIAYTTTAKIYEGGNYVFERTEGPKTVGGVNAENVLKVYYTLDATGTDRPGTPDGIPDQFQITIRYESNANGSVGGTTVEVHTIQDFVRDAETGEIIKTGAVKPASPKADVTVTANSRYTFSHWSIRGNADKSYGSTADLMKEAFVEDVTFAANFRYTGGGSNGGNGGGGGTGDGSHSSKPETGGPGALTTITPDDVPLAILPDTTPADLTMIDDGEVPLAALPKTGQGAMRGTLAMMVSGILLAFAAVGKRKREENNS